MRLDSEQTRKLKQIDYGIEEKLNKSCFFLFNYCTKWMLDINISFLNGSGPICDLWMIALFCLSFNAIKCDFYSFECM